MSGTSRPFAFPSGRDGRQRAIDWRTVTLPPEFGDNRRHQGKFTTFRGCGYRPKRFGSVMDRRCAVVMRYRHHRRICKCQFATMCRRDRTKRVLQAVDAIRALMGERNNKRRRVVQR